MFAQNKVIVLALIFSLCHEQISVKIGGQFMV